MQIPLSDALNLLHRTPWGVLAAASARQPGYPYATPTPYVCDATHAPVLLISALAEHTRNLQADARASLAVTELVPEDVHNAARLTLTGRFEPCTPDAAFVRRFLRYQPAAEQHLALDFSFFRLHIEQARYIGGVGRMGWLAAADLAAAAQLDSDQEAALLASAGPAILGADPWGIDFRQAGVRRRREFSAPLDASALQQALAELNTELSAELAHND